MFAVCVRPLRRISMDFIRLLRNSSMYRSVPIGKATGDSADGSP